jgi:hypothetical protein
MKSAPGNFCRTVSSLFRSQISTKPLPGEAQAWRTTSQSAAASRNFFPGSGLGRRAGTFAPFPQGQLCQQLGWPPASWHLDCDCTSRPFGQSSIPGPGQSAVRRLVMKANRVWIEIVTLSAGVAFGLTLALAIVGAAVVDENWRPAGCESCSNRRASISTRALRRSSIPSPQPVRSAAARMVACGR